MRWEQKLGEYTLENPSPNEGYYKTFEVNFTLFNEDYTLNKKDNNFYLLNKIPLLSQHLSKKLKHLIKLKESTEIDMKRALYLKNIIDSSDFSTELVEIKTTISKSPWYYTKGGLGHKKSKYIRYVPKSVLDESIELSSIRKKHHGNDTFNFKMTKHKYLTKRYSDH